MNLLEVEDRVLRLALHGRDAVNRLRLVLEDVRHEGVLAKILGQTVALLYLDSEEDLEINRGDESEDVSNALDHPRKKGRTYSSLPGHGTNKKNSIICDSTAMLQPM